MIAYLYLESEGYMAFDTGQSYLKFLVPKMLTTINRIEYYDDGYVVMDTNYGEEYLDLKAIAKEVGISVNFNSLRLALREA